METNAGRNQAEIAASRCVFLGFTLDTGRQLLLRGTQSFRLRPQTYDVLLHLLRNAGRLVPKHELIRAVWKDVAVTDDLVGDRDITGARANLTLGRTEGAWGAIGSWEWTVLFFRSPPTVSALTVHSERRRAA